MGNKIYVGNLSYNTTEETLKQIFSEENRTVKKITVITDRETGKPRGFAFAIMGTDEEAQDAIKNLNGRSVDGRSIRLSEAQEKSQNSGFGTPRPPQQYRPPSPTQEEFVPPKTNIDEFPELVPRNSMRSSGDFKNFGHDRMPAQKWDKKKKKRLEPYKDD
jgi:RNA recognition motif-containing protein